jgi:ABC-2 type transport system permease protein
MRNILAIAGKELRGYFSSPIAYVVIGLFALIFGWFFYVPLSFFNRQSMQMSMGMGGTLNINQMLIAPMLTNAGVVILFLMPMITMRTYSEEKRSGTMELLLTSPLTDAQIILGKFLGYLGLFLMGASFLSVGLLISSLTKNQIVAGIATFSVVLMLWVINWMGSFVGPTTQAVLSHLSITDHLDDFARGVLDTKHLVYYLSFIAFGLFLTAKAVDSERWRG